MYQKRGGGGGGGGWGAGTQNFVYQQWPDQIFPIVNFVFSHDGHFGLWGEGPGGGGGGGADPPLLLQCTAILLLPCPLPSPRDASTNQHTSGTRHCEYYACSRHPMELLFSTVANGCLQTATAVTACHYRSATRHAPGTGMDMSTGQRRSWQKQWHEHSKGGIHRRGHQGHRKRCAFAQA